MRKTAAANQIDANAPFKLCMFDAGINPDDFTNCIRNSADEDSFHSCAVALGGPDKRHFADVIQRCTLVADSQIHKTRCFDQGVLGTSCTSN